MPSKHARKAARTTNANANTNTAASVVAHPVSLFDPVPQTLFDDDSKTRFNNPEQELLCEPKPVVLCDTEDLMQNRFVEADLNPELEVETDVDPFIAALDTVDTHARTRPRLPIYETDHEEAVFDQYMDADAVTGQGRDTTVEEDEPPIPVPVPRSQTPHARQAPAPSSAAPTYTSPRPDAQTHSRAHKEPQSPPQRQHPHQRTPSIPPPASGLARSIRVSPLTPATPPTTTKKFTTPLPVSAAPAAPAVVDLGTVGAGGGSSAGSGSGMRGASKKHEEVIQWAHWDELILDRSRRLLLVSYPSTFQIYDTTDLAGVEEVLRLPSATLGSLMAGDEPQDGEADEVELVHAAIVAGEGEAGGEEQAVLGLAFNTGALLTYSLHSHRVLARVHLRTRIEGFETHGGFIVVSTSSPPTLHILSAHTLETLHVIPKSKLAAYAPPPPAIPGGTVESAAGVVSSASAMLSSAFTGWTQAASGVDGTHPHPHTQAQPSNSNFNHYTGRGYGDDNDTSYGYGYGNKDTMYHTPHTHLRNDNTNNNINNNNISNSNVPPPSSSSSQQPYLSQQQQQFNDPPPARAVYALSRRLLAYVSPSSSQASGSSSPSSSSPSPRSGSGKTTTTPQPDSSRSSTSGAQAELRRVGGSVWGGMRTLGGMAVSAARGRIAGEPAATGGGVGRFFSRSAPERGVEGRGAPGDEGTGGGGGVGGSASVPGAGGGGGYVVTVIDLMPLAPPRGKHRPAEAQKKKKNPRVLLEFAVEKEKEIAGLAWAPDGCSLSVIPRDGQAVQVFSARPEPFAQATQTGDAESPSGLEPRNSRPGGGEAGGGGGGAAWHMYTLRRGRTSAVVEGVQVADDARWAAVGSRNRTVHVFGVNPYGGRPDVRSHLEGRVRNVQDRQPLQTEMSPLVRLRAGTTPPQDHPRAPLAFLFLQASTLPAHLLPPSITTPPHLGSHSHSPASFSHQSHSYSHSHSHGTSGSPPASPSHPRRPTNFQDILLFDPVDASLSLRRISLELRPKDQGGVGTAVGVGMGIVSGAAAALGATSISLPGMGGMGMGMGFGAGSGSPSPHAYGSPSKASAGGGAGPFGGRSSTRNRASLGAGEVPVELAARESTVMTWNLRRREGSPEVRKIMGAPGLLVEGNAERKESRGRADWLAQAELSTFSKSPKILPRSIYLSHQFSFHTLGEDYHALIRRYQFDIGGDKIDVRREVQVSAYSAGSGESFVEGGFAAPRDIRHRTLSSSFDEPLASALANELDHSNAPGVLPMYPNGTPGSSGSFRNPIPIRTLGLGDGVSESLGRIRREIGKVRSPRLRPRPDSSMSASVPLEFDEEDEDFIGGDDVSVSVSRETSRGDGGSGPTVSTPATSAHALDLEEIRERERERELDEQRKLEKAEDAWGGWSSVDRLAVEEAERYDNIDVLGLLDEEQSVAKSSVPTLETKRKGRGRKKK